MYFSLKDKHKNVKNNVQRMGMLHTDAHSMFPFS